MADLFLLSNIAAINTRGGSMQRQAEAQKFKNPDDHGKDVGDRESETRTGQINTVFDVVSLSQDVKSLGQTGLSTSAFFSLTETEHVESDTEMTSRGSLYTLTADEKTDRQHDMQRALLAYSQGMSAAVNGSSAQEDAVSAASHAPERNGRPPPAFSLIV